MATTELYHSGECILSLANGDRSVDQVTIVSGQTLLANAVVGKVTASGKFAVYNNGASDGTEVAAGVLVAAVDAASADALGLVIRRDAELKSSGINWGSSDSTAITAGTADLLALGILIRS